MAGTAPTQTHWLFVEAPGSWGRDALATSSLEAAQRAALAALPGHWRVVLVRRPDRPLRRVHDRHVWCTTPEGVASWRLPLAADLLPETLGPGEPVASEVLFVCTNGGRDRCCALLGRRVVDALSPAGVWECSHLGGHRFAATGVRLTDRMVFGRLDPASAGAVLGSATPLDLVRGPAGWPPQVQAAAIAVWRRHGVVPIAGADVLDDTVLLRQSDGSEYRVAVSRIAVPSRLLSCGADPQPGIAFHASL